MHMQIPLKELKHSSNNVRQIKPDKEGIKALAESIKSQGLLHNLIVSKNGTGYEVIDGNRRLSALHILHGNSASEGVNCLVVDEYNNEYGLHANMMRENMHPLDECDAIQKICADGEEDYSTVGKRFGQTERWVQQRVALSELSPKAKMMFRNMEFGIGVASALTLGTHEQQDAYLEESEGRKIYVDSVKRAMLMKKISVSDALFDYTQYKDELGIEGDLFSEDLHITNITRFNDLQMEHINNLVKEKMQEYMDVIFLKDQYVFDSPETKKLRYASDEANNEDVILVLSYNSDTYALRESRMISHERDEAIKELEAQEEEQQELTPYMFTKPQEDLLKSYYADFVKRKLWDTDNGFLEKLMKALICHRRLGYTYSNVNRVGHVYADYQNLYPSEGQPYGYVDPDYEQYIELHIVAAQQAWDNNSICPLHYCLNLHDIELNRLFVAVCLTGLSKYDMLDWTIKETHPDFTAEEKWFKPDMTWLNKYKSEQLDKLGEMLYGVSKGNTKKDKVESIYKFLQESPNFDPFKEPQ